MAGLGAYRERPGAVWRILRPPAPVSTNIRPQHRSPSLPSELIAFQGLVDPALLEAVARRAEALGVGGDEVVRCHRILSPDEITAALASHFGIEIDPLQGVPPPLEAIQTGVFARSARGRRFACTMAPRGLGLRKFCRAIARAPAAAALLRIATPERVAERISSARWAEVAQEAVHGLRRRRPDLSAKGLGWNQTVKFAIPLGVTLAIAGIVAPSETWIAIEYLLAFLFIGWTGLRLITCFVPPKPIADIPIPDRALPIYTIILPLRGEATVVAKLITAIRQLNYPPEKLDIKIMLEEDDAATRGAVSRLRLGAPFEIIAPPDVGPQTKPRALATALLFARGTYVTVFDAEDEPEPEQLRLALAAFAADPTLACVQAKLFVFNVEDSWFSRHFASEYAGQFDIFLPALARLKLPIPLGGTSNHFRVDALRQVGGWDPFNVTEDADLGMRLARFGYRIGVIDSTTWEEAPVGYRQWLNQRRRWFKGWMQTWMVHMRRPLRLRRELGWCNFLAFQLLIGGAVASALVHPFFMLMVAYHLWTGELFTFGETPEQALRKMLALAVLAVGYTSSTALGLLGLSRREQLGSAWVLATIPVYWLLLSWAALQAVRELWKDPHHWEKTPHGLARSSLRGGSHRSSSQNGATSKQPRMAGTRHSAIPARRMLAERAATDPLNPSSVHRRSDIR